MYTYYLTDKVLIIKASTAENDRVRVSKQLACSSGNLLAYHIIYSFALYNFSY